MTKTNAMRILDTHKIPFAVYEYSSSDGRIDGVSVAGKIGKPVETVFKTLVTAGRSKNYYVFVIPVEKELDLKNAAASVGEKSVEMIKVADINKVTGYVRGGCSPVGMKKLFTTVFDDSCKELETICVSGGKIGTQIEVNPQMLIEIVNGKTAHLTY